MHEAIPTPRTRVAIVGAGRAGRLLGRGLKGAGLEVVAASSRSPQGRAVAAAALGIDVEAAPAGVLTARPDLILVCVPDDATAAVVEELAAGLPANCSPLTIAIVSGSVSLRTLDPLAAGGHRVLRMHPLAVLSAGAQPLDIHGAAAGVTAATTDARAYGHALAALLGLRPVDLPDEGRAAWHAAAAIAGNYPVTLLAAARDLAIAAGIDEATALGAMGGLARGALDRAIEEGPELALTGPVSRGDAATVAAHADAIRAAAPTQAGLYRSLGEATLRLAIGAGRLDDEPARAVRAALEGSEAATPLVGAGGAG